MNAYPHPFFNWPYMSPIQVNIDENNWKRCEGGHHTCCLFFVLCCAFLMFLCCVAHFSAQHNTKRSKMRFTTQKNHNATQKMVMPYPHAFSIVLVYVHLDRRHIRSIERGVRVGNSIDSKSMLLATTVTTTTTKKISSLSPSPRSLLLFLPLFSSLSLFLMLQTVILTTTTETKHRKHQRRDFFVKSAPKIAPLIELAINNGKLLFFCSSLFLHHF